MTGPHSLSPSLVRSHPAWEPDRARRQVNGLPIRVSALAVSPAGDFAAYAPGLFRLPYENEPLKETAMLRADYNNISRRILEIEGDDDDLTYNFVDIDFDILRRHP
jgi:hypothetical protein